MGAIQVFLFEGRNRCFECIDGVVEPVPPSWRPLQAIFVYQEDRTKSLSDNDLSILLQAVDDSHLEVAVVVDVGAAVVVDRQTALGRDRDLDCMGTSGGFARLYCVGVAGTTSLVEANTAYKAAFESLQRRELSCIGKAIA